MDLVRQGEGSGVERVVMENMRHQLQTLSQVFFFILIYILFCFSVLLFLLWTDVKNYIVLAFPIFHSQMLGPSQNIKLFFYDFLFS